MELTEITRGQVPNPKPFVSVLANTFRSGGIDILLAGMRDQAYDKNRFECILVDHRYELRHKEVMALAKEMGLVNFTHVPEYKRNGKWVSFASAWNSGFMLAEGEISIILVDYSYTPSQWIDKHVGWHYDDQGRKLKRLAIGPHCYHSMPPFVVKCGNEELVEWIKLQAILRNRCVDQPDFAKIFNEVSIFPEPFKPGWVLQTAVIPQPDQDPKLLYETGPCGIGFVHIKNESYFTKSIYEINGCDETFEQGKGPMDNEFGARFLHSGHELIFDRQNVVFCFNPRFLMSTMPWGDMNKKEEGRWSYYEGEAYQNLRYQQYADGLPAWAPNSYALREKRKSLLAWKKMDEIPLSLLERQ